MRNPQRVFNRCMFWANFDAWPGSADESDESRCIERALGRTQQPTNWTVPVGKNQVPTNWTVPVGSAKRLSVWRPPNSSESGGTGHTPPNVDETSGPGIIGLAASIFIIIVIWMAFKNLN